MHASRPTRRSLLALGLGCLVLVGALSPTGQPAHAANAWPYPYAAGGTAPTEGRDTLPLDGCAAVSVPRVRSLTGDPRMHVVPGHAYEPTAPGGCRFFGTFGRGQARVYLSARTASSTTLAAAAAHGRDLAGLGQAARLNYATNYTTVTAVGRRAGVYVLVGIPGRQAQEKAAVALARALLAYAEARAPSAPPWPGLLRPPTWAPKGQAIDAAARGAVLDLCGRPLAGAQVLVTGTGRRELWGGALTRPDGTFLTGRAPAGTYDVLVLARENGYLGSGVRARVRLGARTETTVEIPRVSTRSCPTAPATAAPTTPPAAAPAAAGPVAPRAGTASVRGRLVDSCGAPVAGLPVAVGLAVTNGVQLVPGAPQSTTADDGTFTVAGVDAGTWAVFAMPSGPLTLDGPWPQAVLSAGPVDVTMPKIVRSSC